MTRIRLWYVKTVVWCIRKSRIGSGYIELLTDRAYHTGFRAGMLQFSKKSLNKKYVNKVKKIIDSAYKKENLNV